MRIKTLTDVKCSYKVISDVEEKSLLGGRNAYSEFHEIHENKVDNSSETNLFNSGFLHSDNSYMIGSNYAHKHFFAKDHLDRPKLRQYEYIEQELQDSSIMTGPYIIPNNVSYNFNSVDEESYMLASSSFLNNNIYSDYSSGYFLLDGQTVDILWGSSYSESFDNNSGLESGSYFIYNNVSNAYEQISFDDPANRFSYVGMNGADNIVGLPVYLDNLTGNYIVFGDSSNLVSVPGNGMSFYVDQISSGYLGDGGAGAYISTISMELLTNGYGTDITISSVYQDNNSIDALDGHIVFTDSMTGQTHSLSTAKILDGYGNLVPRFSFLGDNIYLDSVTGLELSFWGSDHFEMISETVVSQGAGPSLTDYLSSETVTGRHYLDEISGGYLYLETTEYQYLYTGYDSAYSDASSLAEQEKNAWYTANGYVLAPDGVWYKHFQVGSPTIFKETIKTYSEQYTDYQNKVLMGEIAPHVAFKYKGYFEQTLPTLYAQYEYDKGRYAALSGLEKQIAAFGFKNIEYMMDMLENTVGRLGGTTTPADYKWWNDYDIKIVVKDNIFEGRPGVPYVYISVTEKAKPGNYYPKP